MSDRRRVLDSFSNALACRRTFKVALNLSSAWAVTGSPILLPTLNVLRLPARTCLHTFNSRGGTRFVEHDGRGSVC